MFPYLRVGSDLLDRRRSAVGRVVSAGQTACVSDQAAHPGAQLWYTHRLPHVPAGGHHSQSGGGGEQHTHTVDTPQIQLPIHNIYAI